MRPIDADRLKEHIDKLPTLTNVSSKGGDTIYRQAAIDALWKALHEYEDKTEKQFQESEDLDVGEWIEHRIFVQNMNDIDRQTILNLPSTEPAQPTDIQDILKYLDTVLHPIVSPDHWNVYSELHDMISSLLSERPERKKGKWIGTEFDGYADGNPVFYEWKCSVCDCVVEDEEPTWNFCPNCGARMEGTE